jgi:hypothetical protein
MQIDFKVNHVARAFLVCVLFLFAAHISMLLIRYGLGHGSLMGLSSFVDLWSENNLPTFYSSMSLLFCGLLLYLISLSEQQSGGKFVLYWLGLAAIFTFLSVDEMLMIHDRISDKLRALGASGAFYFAWVIPYGIATVGLGIIYLRFLLNLTPQTRALFIMAAVCYVGGALGFEMIGAIEYEKVQNRTLLMDVYNLIEETLEMVGVLIFIWGLTYELARRKVGVQFLAAPVVAEMSVLHATIQSKLINDLYAWPISDSVNLSIADNIKAVKQSSKVVKQSSNRARS